VFNFSVIITEQVGEVVPHCTCARELLGSNLCGISAILTEVYLGFPQLLQTNMDIRPRQISC
jgi:hypothetical protein